VMPNHLHGIMIIHNPEPIGAGLVPAHATRATTSPAPFTLRVLRGDLPGRAPGRSAGRTPGRCRRG
jgi:hypothetical protein